MAFVEFLKTDLGELSLEELVTLHDEQEILFKKYKSDFEKHIGLIEFKLRPLSVKVQNAIKDKKKYIEIVEEKILDCKWYIENFDENNRKLTPEESALLYEFYKGKTFADWLLYSEEIEPLFEKEFEIVVSKIECDKRFEDLTIGDKIESLLTNPTYKSEFKQLHELHTEKQKCLEAFAVLGDKIEVNK